jgi:hypothetical protein
MARRSNAFQTIRSEGGLLPPDLLRHVLNPKEKLPGTRPEDYGLPLGERLNELITQSWNSLRKHWTEFRATAAHLPAGETGTVLTNDRWSLPLLRELAFGLLPATGGPEIGGRTYAISRFFGPVPVHLLGCNLSLDRRAAGVRGAAAVNPHGLVQEFLNRSSSHLWAIVSNGLCLRVLRDNQALSRQSFLEFDLEAMFDGEVFSDFVLLWLMAHATRFAPREGDRPETCWLEQWTKLANEQGTRALGDLRIGVEEALRIMGEGFTSHPKNLVLREALRTGKTPLTDFHGQLLRLVYRLIFLFVAEDRTIEGQSLLHPRDESDAAQLARERYAAHYSTGRLRELASRIKGSRHGDLWRQFQLMVGALSGDKDFDAVREHLALPVLGSFLWDPASTAALNDAELTNYDFLEALRHLAFTRQGKVLRPVDYKNLGAEELGGVYESLLALTPQISADGARFTFTEFAGSERKTSGSYYTPDSLVQCLLDSALDPVVEDVIKGKTGAEAEKAILALKVCDPAVGSGHFLVGAAHRLARHLARVRALVQGESEPSPLLYQHALRDVIGRSLYGVDVNPMAAELCRVNLWLEALDPGKPLSFLDHHIRVGNSLLGATPELIAAGLPDDAFKPIEGDDRKACTVLKKRNQAERKKLGPLFAQQDAETQARLQQAAAALEELPDHRPEDIRTKELAFRRHEETEEYRRKKQLADAWCAAFVIRKHFREPSRESSAGGITQGNLNDLASGRPLPADLAVEAERLSAQYRFFHWHLAFPEVFSKGGFDCMLGNPPWEGSDLMKVEFFAALLPDVASARTTDDRLAIMGRAISEDPRLELIWENAQRENIAQSHFTRSSGRYPLTSGGKLNTYRTFAELSTCTINESGRMGMVLKSGIINAQDNQKFFASLLRCNRVVAAFDFINTKELFTGVVANERFCLLTATGDRGDTREASFMFCLEKVEQLSNAEQRIGFKSEDLLALNPNDLSVPPLTSAADKDLLVIVHKYIPVLVDEGRKKNPLHVRYARGHLNSSTNSNLFAKNFFEALASAGLVDKSGRWNSDELRPLIEGKLIGMWNHRFGSFLGTPWATRFGKKAEARDPFPEELRDPQFRAVPRFWLRHSDAQKLIAARNYSTNWILTYRHVCRAIVDARTAQVCISPNEPTSDSCTLLLFDDAPASVATAACLLVAAWSSFVGDYVLRQKIYGPALTKAIAYQLPAPCIQTLEARDLGCIDTEFVKNRALELTYTAWDLEPFANDCGWSGPPFHWDEERRFLLRCELDAAFFHLYLPAEANGCWHRAQGETEEDLARLKASFPTPRDAVAYIMDTFPIVRRKDEKKYDGDYRSKRVILEIYDAMAEAIRTGQPYQNRLDPPPADPRCCHPPRGTD